MRTHNAALRWTVISALLLIAVLLVTVSGSVTTVTASRPEAAPPPQVHPVNSFSAQANLAPARDWTEEEMRNAKPMPMERSGTPNRGVKSQGELKAQGAPQWIPGGAPEGETLPAPGAPTLLSAPSPTGYSYPAPFTRYENFDDYKVYPYVTVGKLFFQQNGGSYVCSASVVGGGGPGGYSIWTAGHCVNDGSGNWSTNMVFSPAYKDGKSPKKQWHSAYEWAINAWINSADLRYDYGVVVLSGSKKITQKVGWLGFAYNLPDQTTAWFLMGYPQAAPFNGERQQICASSFAYNDTSFGSPWTDGVGCDQTGGTSGGPWIWQFSGGSGATNYLNGNNSYRYNSNPLELYSPYFGGTAYGLWLCAFYSTPTTPACS